jgi:hypothetical protein
MVKQCFHFPPTHVPFFFFPMFPSSLPEQSVRTNELKDNLSFLNVRKKIKGEAKAWAKWQWREQACL